MFFLYEGGKSPADKFALKNSECFCNNLDPVHHLCSTITATTSKFKMAVEIGVFRLIREALYFFYSHFYLPPQQRAL